MRHFVKATVLILASAVGISMLGVQNFERFRSGDYLNGLAWVVMSSEERSVFLLGFEDGIRAGVGRAADRKGPKDGEQEDKILHELLIRNRPGVDVVGEISRIYKDDRNLHVPISLVYYVVRVELTPEGERLAMERLRSIAKR